MQMHIRRVHDGLRTEHVCDVCDAGFANPSNLSYHIKAKHSMIKDLQASENFLSHGPLESFTK